MDLRVFREVCVYPLFELIDELGRILSLNVSELPDSPLESSSCSDGKVFGEFRVGVRWM